LDRWSSNQSDMLHIIQTACGYVYGRVAWNVETPVEKGRTQADVCGLVDAREEYGVSGRRFFYRQDKSVM
jgi:hypothetical protein